MTATWFVKTHASIKDHSCQSAPGTGTGAPPARLLFCLGLMGWWTGAKASGKRDSGFLRSQLGSHRGRGSRSPL